MQKWFILPSVSLDSALTFTKELSVTLNIFLEEAWSEIRSWTKSRSQMDFTKKSNECNSL